MCVAKQTDGHSGELTTGTLLGMRDGHTGGLNSTFPLTYALKHGANQVGVGVV